MSTQNPGSEGDETPRTEETDVLGLFDAPAEPASTTMPLPPTTPPSATTPPSPTVPVPPVTPPAATSAPSTASTPSAAPERQHAPLRVGTVVWGLILAAVGFGVVASASGAEIDLELALISLMGVGGVALLVGSILTARRRRD